VDGLWDGPDKSFGILVDEIGAGHAESGDRRDRPTSRVTWDISGMVVGKCPGILIEGYRGGWGKFVKWEVRNRVNGEA